MLTTPEIVEVLCEAERLSALQKRGPARKLLLRLIADLTGQAPPRRDYRVGIDWQKVLADPANHVPATVLVRRYGVAISTVLGAARRHGVTLPRTHSLPGSAKGIDWQAVFADPENRRLSRPQLARKLGLAVASVRTACKKYKVDLPKGQGGTARKAEPKRPRRPEPPVPSQPPVPSCSVPPLDELAVLRQRVPPYADVVLRRAA